MRNILNIIVDILTLLAITVAGAGHLLPWFSLRQSSIRPPTIHFGKEITDLPKIQEEQKQIEEEQREKNEELMDFQAWHAIRSGPVLGIFAVFVGLSLAFSWGPTCRRILVLLMFAAALTSVLFLTLPFSTYPITEMHCKMAEARFHLDFYLVAFIPSCIALGLTLLRMIWTMPPVRNNRGSIPVLKTA